MKLIQIESLLVDSSHLRETLNINSITPYEEKYNKLIKDFSMIYDKNSYTMILKYLSPFITELCEDFIEKNIFGVSTVGFKGSNDTLRKGSDLTYNKNIKYFNERLMKLNEIIFIYYIVYTEKGDYIRAEEQLKYVLRSKDGLYNELKQVGIQLFEELRKYMRSVQYDISEKIAKDIIERNGVTYTTLYYEPDFKEIKDKTDILIRDVEEVIKRINSKSLRDLRKANINITFDFQSSHFMYLGTKDIVSGFYNKATSKISYRDLVDFSQGKEERQETIAHELGHQYFDTILNSEQRTRWENFFNSNNLYITMVDLGKLVSSMMPTLEHLWTQSFFNKKELTKESNDLLNILKTHSQQYLKGSVATATIAQYLNNVIKDIEDNNAFDVFVKAFSSKVSEIKGSSVSLYIFNFLLQYGLRDDAELKKAFKDQVVKFLPLELKNSDYGQSNYEEFYAESFSYYIMEKKLPPIVTYQFSIVSRVP